MAICLIGASVNAGDAAPATSVAHVQKGDTCSVLGELSGLEDYEIPSFSVRCERMTLESRPEVTGDPTVADFLVATDPALAATAYRLLGMYKLAKDLGLSKSALAEQSIWYATLRRTCTSKDCLRTAYRDRLHSLTTALQVASDPLPGDWSGNREEAGCPDDRRDSFRLTYEIKGPRLRGEVSGSLRCSNKVFDIDLRGTISGHLAFVHYEAGWSDEQQPAEAVMASREGHVYWEVLTPIEVEDYVWHSADTTGH